jgi:hypothetical protein
LRFHARIKDGKDHCYWSVVENRRCGRGKVVQRQVLSASLAAVASMPMHSRFLSALTLRTLRDNSDIAWACGTILIPGT